jgi:uncharacterized membrane protein
MSGSTEAGSPQGEGGATETAPIEEPKAEGTATPPGGEPSAPPEGEPSAPPEGEPSAAPPPSPEDESAERDELLTHGSRAVLLATLIGAAVASWTQFAFRSPWLDELIIDNTLGPDLRKRLLVVLVAGAVLGAGGCAGAIAWLKRRGVGVAVVEQWTWFLSPLLFLPLAPLLFRAKAWMGRHAELLPILALVVIALEFFVSRSLANAPDSVRKWWADVRTQMPAIVKRRGPIVLVVVASIAYAAFFIFFTLRWHYKLRTGNYDLSINNNLMYGGLHGNFLESPVVFPKNPPQYLANHAKFGAYLFLPIYALVPRPETLLVIQSTFIGVGAVPLFLFARRHVSEWMAALLCLAYLCYYPMHGASFSEFQAVPLTAFFVFLAAWAVDSKRYRILAFAVVVALSMREDVAVGIAVFGAFLLLSGYRPLPGLVIASSAVAYFLFLRFYVMEEAGSWWFPNMYRDLWADGEKGFRSVIRTAVTNPMFTLTKVIVEKKIVYLLHLLVPLAFLPARRWYLWAAFAPGAMLTLLVTNYDPPITFSFHYVMHWAPYLFMAAVLYLKVVAKEKSPIRARAALTAVIASSLVLTYNYGAFPRREGSFKGGFNKIEFGYSDVERARYDRLMELVRPLPRDVPIAATEKIGPHISSRVTLYAMRNGPQTAEYIVASSRELKLSKTKPHLKEALESKRYGVIRRVGDFALMKRGADPKDNDELLSDWGL